MHDECLTHAHTHSYTYNMRVWVGGVHIRNALRPPSAVGWVCHYAWCLDGSIISHFSGRERERD